jgi:hypothetical protein
MRANEQEKRHFTVFVLECAIAVATHKTAIQHHEHERQNDPAQ